MAAPINMIYGRHPVLEALESGRQVDKIILQRRLQLEVKNKIIASARNLGVPVQFVPVEKLNRLTKGSHQGVVAFLSSVIYYKIEDVLPQIYEKGRTPLLLILDGITDVRNTGAIARTAVAAGADAIIIPEKNTAPINADAVKASAGALSKINCCRHSNLKQVIEFLQTNGIKVFAMDGMGNEKVQNCNFNLPAAIVIGAEDKGIDTTLLRYTDHIIKLPNPGNFDSYNVSVATGMVLYEVMRQRL